MMAIGIILIVGLGVLAALVVLLALLTPLPWWGALILLPLLDAVLILWARRRLKRPARASGDAGA
ncbi:MAG: hypothetical protein F4185_08925 [Chloroflexi bacterium]|nr:hypothetical protein [Chloroflexota bacterium]MYA51746.1 hypothetical protein [Chloroflexota bacterium]MYB83265.1 hypothetical protein [Chloroflexota bacterium]MYF65941.1 hypothetical protein [Chloroflexota bacterium]MYK35268.1 hypothetical protein [Chloroflexota bacterium]